MKTPDWMKELSTKVCLENNHLPAKITCRRRRDTYSGGTYCQGGTIKLNVGRSKKDSKVVLLHELAHYFMDSLMEGHTERFWRKCWELYQKYEVDLRYARWREKTYRAGAEKVYRSMHDAMPHKVK